MLNRFRIFPTTSTITLRPRLACEISAAGVMAARQEGDLGSSAITAFAPLRAGLVVPSLNSPNIPDPRPVVAALRQALDDVADRNRQVSLIIPDLAARVLLLEFDTLPTKLTDALPILRFRLRKLLPFEVEDAAISYQVLYQDANQVRTVVAVTPRSVLAEYESALREAGYLPGAVLPSTLATLAVVPETSNALVVNCSNASVTSAITRGNELLLYRTLDLPESSEDRSAELQQLVAVAMAYFEDTLAAPPEALDFVGPGGAAEMERMLNDPAVLVRDLVPTPTTGAATSMPGGLLAGVMGALAN